MLKRDLFGNIILVIITVIFFIILRIVVFSTHKISADESNYYLKQNDKVLISKLSIPTYKDFVLYEVEGKEYLGRVVAKEGDVPTYREDIYYLNQEVIHEGYLEVNKQAFKSNQTLETMLFTEDFTLNEIAKTASAKIPDNHYLILNDNRQNHQDSRRFGLISRQQIKGVVSFTLSPLEKFGFLRVE